MSAALLLTALFNGAWQGALLCGFAVIVFRIFRRLNATTMFTVWNVLLLITLALPVANAVFAPKPYTVRVQAAPVQITSWHASTAPVARVKTPVRSTRSTPVVYRLEPRQPTLRERAASIADAVFARAATILWIALAIALLRLAVLAADVVRMLQARRRVHSIDPPVLLTTSIARPFEFAASRDFTSPCVLGFAPALIVIPDELLTEPDEKLFSIVLHEREHVRRFDDVQNVIQRFIGAVAFFCPGVRIALRELALYREQICDDAAIDGTGDRVSYAMTLTRMSGWAQGRGAPVPSLIFKRKQLMHRLEVLLDTAVSHSLRMDRRFAVSAAVALALAALLVLRIQVPVIAESIVAPVAPPLPAARVRVAPMPAPVAPKIAPIVKPMPPPEMMPAKLHAMQAKLQAMQVRARSVAPLPPLVAARAKIAALAPPAPHLSDESAALEQVAASLHEHMHAHEYSDDLLDALNQAGLHNLSVDQLIAIRDHGVSTSLVRSAVGYFGRNISAFDLTTLADSGVSPSYLDDLRSEGVTGIPPASVVMLMDHGVSARFIRAAMAYFSPRPSAADLSYMTDHGVSDDCLRGFARAGLSGISPADVSLLVDHGVNASYIAKVHRLYPHASVADIIRLHDAGI